MDQLSLDQSPGITGQKIMQDAKDWIMRNHYAWHIMRGMAASFVREGKHFSISYLAERARYEMYTKGYTDGFKINNTTRSGLARILIKEVPGCSHYLEIRSSKADWAS